MPGTRGNLQMPGKQTDQTDSFIQFGQGRLELAAAKFDIENPQEAIYEYNVAIGVFKQAISLASDKGQLDLIKELLVTAYVSKAKAHKQQQDLTTARDCYLCAKTYCESLYDLSCITLSLEALKIGKNQAAPEHQASPLVEKQLTTDSKDNSGRKGGLAIYLDMHNVLSSEIISPKNTARVNVESLSSSQHALLFSSPPHFQSIPFASSSSSTHALSGTAISTHENQGHISDITQEPKISVSTVELNKFLHHVGFGEQNEAEKMLQDNPVLATLKGDLTDCSVYPETYDKHRVFPNITALQYAVWALDFHMWKMIKQHMEKNNQQQYIRAQLEELNDIARLTPQQGWLIRPGKTISWPLISWTKLIEVLEKHVRIWDVIHLCQQVGGAQLTLPAHVINEYSHPSRSFYPYPQWGDTEASLPRTGVNDWINNRRNKLGKDFAWFRGSGGRAKPMRIAYTIGEAHRKVVETTRHTDSSCLNTLLASRTEQARGLLKSVLGSRMQPSSPRP